MYFNHEDINLYYEKYGNHKKSIVILPGWGNTRKTFDYLISFLENYFTIYIVDYPGFGNTHFPNKNLTIYDYSNLIYEFIKFLNLDDPILIGHSFGGRIIITLLGYYQYKFSNIILMNSAGIKPKKTLLKRFKIFFYKFLQKSANLLPKKLKIKLKNYLFNKFSSSDYKNLNDNMKITFKNVINEDLTPYLKNIRTKSLLIWGNKDYDTPIKDANIMNKFIDNSELIILDKASHFSYLEQPKLINRILFEQLKNEIK